MSDRDDAVFLLWHVMPVDPEDPVDDEKLIGVYESEASAEAAIARLRGKPGFAESPEGFQIGEYVLDKDHWTDGFVDL